MTAPDHTLIRSKKPLAQAASIHGDLTFPVAWAPDASASFVEPTETYRKAMTDAGFEVQSEQQKADVGLKFFAAIKARLAAGGPPPLGLHLVMGSDAKTKVGNMNDLIETGLVAPVLMVARRT